MSSYYLVAINSKTYKEIFCFFLMEDNESLKEYDAGISYCGACSLYLGKSYLGWMSFLREKGYSDLVCKIAEDLVK